jgi:hypothetical protein
MLDIKIIFITNAIALFVLSLYMMLRHRNHVQNRTVKFVTYFVVLYFLGFVLLLLRNKIPDFLSIVVANSFFVAGSVSLYVATRAILNLDAKWHLRYVVPVVVIFVGFIIFTYLDYDTATRIVIYFSFCTMFSLLSGYLFWVHASKRFIIFDKLSAMMFFGGAVLDILIIIRALSTQLAVNYLSITDAVITLSNLFLSVLILWFVLLVNYRIKK